MKIEKRAALTFRDHPLCQFRDGDVRRAELEFVPFLRLDNGLSRCCQFVAQLFVMGALFRRQRLDVAIKLILRGDRLPARLF